MEVDSLDCETDLRRRCERAVELMLEARMPLHLQVNRVLEVFNQLTLDNAQAENERILFRHFAQVNAVIAKYEIQSTKDYRNMSFRDLYSILFIIKDMIEKLDLTCTTRHSAE